MGIGDGGFKRIALFTDWHTVFTSGCKRAAVERQDQIRRSAFERIQFLLGFFCQLWNRTEQCPGVWMLGIVEDFPCSTALYDLTGIHNLNSVCKVCYNTQVVGNQDDRIRSMICAWMVTSSAVVGSSAIRIFGLHARAIAIITRCLIPPDISCG